LFEALGCDDKTYVDIEGADHYYIEKPELLPKATAAVVSWMDARGL
jgi:hypothetical protein